MFLVSLMSKALTGSLVFYFATSILPTQIDEVWLVRLFPVMRLLQRNPFIQQTSVKTCCVPGLGTWTSKIIKHNHPHFSWHCGSLILFMACLILSSNDEHLVSIIYVIIHHPFFFFLHKSLSLEDPQGQIYWDSVQYPHVWVYLGGSPDLWNQI